MTHHRCNPPLPLDTPKGKGWAHWMIDRSQEHGLEWVVFLDDTGESCTFQNSEIRLQMNPTMGRYAASIPPQTP